MAFTVESGNGEEDSTSYVSVEYADGYHTDLNNTAWTAETVTDEMKQFALMRATAYIDSRWQGQWRGTRLLSTQALQWPRSEAYDNDDFALTGVPSYLAKLTCEIALIQLTDPTVLNSSISNGGGTKRVTVAGAVTEEYFQGYSPSTVYPVFGQLVAPLIRAGAGQIPTSRG